MAKSTWFRGPPCGTSNCRSRLYRTTDGLTICQFGHVLEGAIEINDDQDQAIVTTKRLKHVQMDDRGSYSATPQVGGSQMKRDEGRVFGREAKEVYLRTISKLLKLELDKIVEVFGFSENVANDLENIVKRNWVNVLGSVHRGDDHDDEIEQEEEETEPNEEKHEGVEMSDNKYKDKQIDALDVIAIIYLSLLEIRAYPIYVSDILEKIKSNEIPYIRTLHLIPKKMLDKLPIVYHNRLQMFSLPTNTQIYRKIQVNLTRLNKSMTIPIDFYFPYIFRILSEVLILPNTPDLFMTSYELLKLLNINEFIINPSKSTQFLYNYPEIYLACIIIFIGQLSFKTNLAKFSSFHWLKTLEEYELQSSYDTNVLNWSDGKINNYCDWLYDNVIYKKSNEDLTTTEKRLYQIFNYEKEDTSHENRVVENKDDNISLVYKTLMKMDCQLVATTTATEEEINNKLFMTLSTILGITSNDLIKCYDYVIKQIKKIK
ncbi:RRN7 [[Candida] subhashii]|uniref:RRN7 n=1 Tax=[Candida] subhashii TaxID=561895 RepID=A0A8J5QM97_9ASCO|nr:RRN7 [[Candida] subhashii]KAG7662917.1 RRN7 [[Candida] subhashii]